MLIRWANPDDKESWLDLATEVAPIFEAPDMPLDPDFHQFIDSKLQSYETLIAIDSTTGNCMGIISFSKKHNQISWLGVYENQRSIGVGTKLLKCTLSQLDPSNNISVITFRAGYLPGTPARSLYIKFGFVDEDNGIYDNLGNPRCKMELKAGNFIKEE